MKAPCTINEFLQRVLCFGGGKNGETAPLKTEKSAVRQYGFFNSDKENIFSRSGIRQVPLSYFCPE